MIGMGEVAEEFAGGILAPPDSDYRQEDLEDDDYDNKNDDYYDYDIYWSQKLKTKYNAPNHSQKKKSIYTENN